MHIDIVHLYPHSMNTYGDTGNCIVLTQRCQARGITVTIHPVEIGEAIPETADLYFFGGGQDAAQGAIGADILRKAKRLSDDVARGVPILAICGGYQLLGRSYLPFDQESIRGAGIFPVETKASHDRMIGNLIVKADPAFGFSGTQATVVGFENHSGKTYILPGTDAHPLGTVVSGKGNNGEDSTEGCVVGSAIGCYMHGSLLPKNPHIADWLIQKACAIHEPDFKLTPLDDSIEWAAHDVAVSRYA